MNWHAMQWAYDQDDLNVTAKATLVTFAMHANQRGYTWPGVDRIASAWGMDRETVRRQIQVLLVRRLIRPTKKRRGATGQVKVYRMPKITYESSGKARDKRGISGGKSAPNNDNNRTTNKYHDVTQALGNSTPLASVNGSLKSVSCFFEGYQNQNQPVQNHVNGQSLRLGAAAKAGHQRRAVFGSGYLDKNRNGATSESSLSIKPATCFTANSSRLRRRTDWAERTPNSSPNSAKRQSMETKSMS